MQFLDQCKIYLKSGDGGRGAASFRGEELIDFRYRQHCRAPAGRPSAGRELTGARGEDLVLTVPVGTQVMDDENREVLADLTRPGERRVFLRGGDGGFGNAHYKSSANRAA